MTHILPQLPYAYDALEPHVDAQTMEIHHSKHHQTYINNLNNAVKDTELEHVSAEELLSSIEKIPTQLKQAIINNAGGHANHSLFWKIMDPHGGGDPINEIAQAIDAQLGGFNTFKESFTQAALTRFGSG